MSPRLAPLILVIPLSACVQQERVVMRDGVELATTVWLPPGPGPFPALLERTPYGRRSQPGDLRRWLDAGVAVVSQDMRGRFDSEGEDRVFTTEGDGELSDGYDTLLWLTEQPFSDGRVATAGASALGIVQYLQASTDPPGLVALAAAVATPDLYRDAMFQGGVRRYALSHNWLEAQGSLAFEAELAAHPFADAFWDPVQAADRFAAVDVPGVHVGGWFDIFQQGTIDAFRGYQHEGADGARGRQKLVMGPWTHGGVLGRAQGELTFPANAALPPHPQLVDVVLTDALGVEVESVTQVPGDIPAVQYYVMGDVDDPEAPGNEWRVAADWPPPAGRVRMHLQPGGGLAEGCPAQDGGGTAWVADPDDPAPTVCGANLTIAAGPCDQREVEARDDVVVFETPVLEAPLEITGRLSARLFVEVDGPDADVVVRLTDVYPDGRSMLLTDAPARLAARGSTTGLWPIEPGELVEVEVDLWSTSVVLAPGHRLRASLGSSSWPRFAVNRNNGLPYPASVEGEGGPVTVRVRHEAGAASYLDLPVPGREPAAPTPCDQTLD